MRGKAGVILSVVWVAFGFGCAGERSESGVKDAGPGTGGAGSGGDGAEAGGGGAGAAGKGGNAGAPAPGGTAGASGGSAGVSDGGTAAVSGAPGGGAGGGEASGVLVFSRTLGFRHDSIPDGVNALSSIAAGRGWDFRATEDASAFSDENLASYRLVVFLSTTGDVLDADQQAALERFVRAGGGFMGVHSASDTEYDWPFYGGLVGAYFRAHPAIQEAVVRVELRTHPSTVGLPAEWRRTDEWYAFAENPRANVTVLLTLDESTYDAGSSSMGADHPIAWFHEYEGGRAFYTALGHTRESYAEPEFVAHLAGAMEWVAGR